MVDDAAEPVAGASPDGGRVARNRGRRTDEFVQAGPRPLPAGILGAGIPAGQLDRDLCSGWGADRGTVERIDRAVDDAARSIPLRQG